MFISVLKDILSEQRLEEVRDIVSRATFVSGEISGGTDATKKNLEMPPDDESYLKALRVVEGAVRGHREFMFTAFPRHMTRPIFSRYEEGMFYDYHTDFPIMNFYSPTVLTAGHRALMPLGQNYVRSDLSMTLFLGTPDSYDGGELSFCERGESLRFKLPAGSAVLYPTGAPHCVMSVRRGVRLAAIFWIQSMFPAEAHRRLVHQSFRLAGRLGEVSPSSPEQRLAEEISHNLFRTLAAV